MTQTISHWIDGKRRDGCSGHTGPVFDPATGQETARVAFASVEEVDSAVVTAAGERRLHGSLNAEARVVHSRALPHRSNEPLHGGPVEEIDPTSAHDPPASAAEHHKARGVIIHAIGDSLAFHPLFCPPFCPP